MFEEVRGGMMATIKREKFFELQNKGEENTSTATMVEETTKKTTKKNDSSIENHSLFFATSHRTPVIESVTH